MGPVKGGWDLDHQWNPIRTSISSLFPVWALEIASENGMATSNEHERHSTKPCEGDDDDDDDDDEEERAPRSSHALPPW
ncbi:hypothetical protein LX36DRAFT_654010 [Colletotrichum falcatum]|nr:hypothetical protein LX36DRAFT_654010 [Colletotrichum falcatum]